MEATALNRLDDVAFAIQRQPAHASEAQPRSIELDQLATDFGNPLTTDGYALCLYDESGTPALLYEMKAPFEPGCVSPLPCWKALGKPPLSKGAKYTNKVARPDGITNLSMKPGIAGKAGVQVKGKGSHLPFVAAPAALPLPLRVQLRAENGNCWEAVYSAAKVNDGIAFKANSQ